MTKRRRKKSRRVRLGDAAQESFHRQIIAAVNAAQQARKTKNCRSAQRTFEEAELYYGRAVLEQTNATHVTLDMRRALTDAKRVLQRTRETVATTCNLED
jgi:hypothetical protein